MAKNYRVFGVAVEESWETFYGDLEEAYRKNWTLEGGDILIYKEYPMCDKTFPTLKAARKYVAHCAGVPVAEVKDLGRRTWLRHDLPEDDWRYKAFLDGFDTGANWIIEEI